MREENGAGQGAAATVAVGSRNPGQWETFGRGTWVLVGLGRLGLGSGQPCGISNVELQGRRVQPNRTPPHAVPRTDIHPQGSPGRVAFCSSGTSDPHGIRGALRSQGQFLPPFLWGEVAPRSHLQPPSSLHTR